MNIQHVSIQRIVAICIACAGLFFYSATATDASASEMAMDGDCVNCGSIADCRLFGSAWGYEHCSINFYNKPPCKVSGDMCRGGILQ